MFFESIALNAAIIIALIVALSLDYLTKFFSYWYVRHVPYSRPVPAFGSDLRRVFGLADATDVAGDLYRRHPTAAYVGYFRSRIPDLIVRDPDTIGLILHDRAEHFRDRGLGLHSSLDRSIADNLFYADGELWSALWSRVSGFFTAEKPWGGASERALSGLERELPNEPRECDVLELTSALAVRMLREISFGREALASGDEQILSQLVERLRSDSIGTKIRRYFMSIFPSLYSLFNMSRLDGALVRSLKRTISPVTEGTDEGSLVRFLLAQKEVGPMDVTGEGRATRKGRRRVREFDDDVVASQVVSLAEGLVPCGTAAAMTLYELARSPRELAAVLRELDGNVGDKGALAAAVDETLRLHPAHGVLSRVCVTPCKLPDTDIVLDKGVTVTVPVAAIHRDPAHFTEPDTFDPSRFQTDQLQKRHPYTYLPFGAGPRSCIGSRLALHWTRACVSGVLRGHTVSPCARTPAPSRSHAAPAKLWLTISPRASTTS